MKLNTILFILAQLTICGYTRAQLLDEQASKFSKADSLRGSLNALRSCYDVLFYDLDLKVIPEKKYISGSNTMYFDCVKNTDGLQFDLFREMHIDSVTFRGKPIEFRRMHNAVFVQFPEIIQAGERASIQIFYGGTPIEAKMPPWDGGFVWKKDDEGSDWIGVACEGIGASLWWPNKDHLSDEPDSMQISCAVPTGLMCVANGDLVKRQLIGHGYEQFVWRVTYPINNYNVTLNIGNYAIFSDEYQSKEIDEPLKLDYYVLKKNIAKAKEHFKQVHPTLEAFEHYFGKYPFTRDGFALVETPYLGMEHQGAIAYGNEYKPGYLGNHMEGVDFDYIIVHEAGHEWWGNSISCQDIADLWIHEGFCTYSEMLFVEYWQGYDLALKYVNRSKGRIGNKRPIVGVYGVNSEGSSDMYSKGSLILNTLRHIIQNDSLWFAVLKEMIAEDFYIKTTNTDEVVAYLSKRLNRDLVPFFDQYLRYPSLPVLEYKIEKLKRKSYAINFRWKTDVENFSMPVRVKNATGEFEWIETTNNWSSMNVTGDEPNKMEVDLDRTYIELKRLK